jgi:hypothetical protein
MTFNEETEQYLSGEKFSSGLKLKISSPEKSVLNRIGYIIQLAKDKDVLHLGCCDHIPIIKEKIASHRWLHQYITQHASSCLGLDIDKEAVDYVTQNTEFKNVFWGNITADEKIDFIKDRKFDLMVMGEILEHTDDPVSFLKKIKANYAENIKNILITVPNAFSINNTYYSKRHIEFINSDHRFFFTPFTLGKVVTRAGFKIIKFDFADNISSKKNSTGLRRIKNYPRIRYLSKHPAKRETLMMLIE